MAPRSATASTAIAFGMPLLISVVPSIGSTATSTSGPPCPVADPLAVEEHRRVVLLALADDHGAPHRQRVDQLAHGVDGGAVAALLVAAADPAAGGHGGRLGHPDQFQRQVPVEILGARAAVRTSSASSRGRRVAAEDPGRPGVSKILTDRVAPAHRQGGPVVARRGAVGQDGGVSNPSAPAPSHPTGPGRAGRRYRDMAISLVVLLIPVAVLVACSGCGAARTSSWSTRARRSPQAQRASAFPVAAPASSGEGWRPVSAAFQPKDAGGDAAHRLPHPVRRRRAAHRVQRAGRSAAHPRAG